MTNRKSLESALRREVHGVTLKAGARAYPRIVRETDTEIIIDGAVNIHLGITSARHLARVLYRLAGRLEKRVFQDTNGDAQ